MLATIRGFVEACNYFFAVYLIVYCTYLIISNIYGSIKMFRYRRLEKLHNVLDHSFYYPLSIIVPAYNEEVSIVQTINNLLELDYSLYEIIVVDDGSKDNTKNIVIEEFNLKKEEDRPIRYSVPCKPINEIYVGKVKNINITLVSKENGGSKADASNAGINLAVYPYFVNMDADEIVQRDALKYACRALLESDNVIGVGVNIKISNNQVFEHAMPVRIKMGKNLLVNMQILEYGRGFVGAKIFQNKWNMNLIISGGFGIFDKAAVIEVGGFDTTSMGEDMELTLRLHQHYRKNKKKYSMKFVPDSVCWTQGVENFKDLKAQRQRWHCGLMQSILKYKYMILNPKYGVVGMFMLPFTIMYELLNSVFVLLGWFVIGWAIFDNTINIHFAFYLYFIYFIFGIFLTIVTFLDKAYMKNDMYSVKDVFICIGCSIIESLVLRPYLAVITFLALFKMKKIAKNWKSPVRVKVQS